MYRARSLAAALLTAATVCPSSPAHAAGTVKAEWSGFAQGEAGSAFVFINCTAQSSGSTNTAVTEVWCKINSAAPEYFGTPGPASTATWYGSADMPVRVCVWAQATFRDLSKATDGPKCQEITPP